MRNWYHFKERFSLRGRRFGKRVIYRNEIEDLTPEEIEGYVLDGTVRMETVGNTYIWMNQHWVSMILYDNVELRLIVYTTQFDMWDSYKRIQEEVRKEEWAV